MSRLRRGPFVYLTLSLVCLQVFPVSAAPAQPQPQPPLADRINTVVQGADYKQSHWGILVVDEKTGEVVYAHNADKMFLPASVTKLFSVAAALLLLGVDFVF